MLPLPAFLKGNLPRLRKSAWKPPAIKFRVVSFYTTGNGYDVSAARLRASLDKLNISHWIEERPLGENWEETCALKARFVFEKWSESDIPIVWLDADATVEIYPSLFEEITHDFAVHKWTWSPETEAGFQFGSGTLYFGKGELTQKLIEQWVLRSRADPTTWDQTHLESAWCDIAAAYPLKTYWLPRSYLQIDGGSILEPPVIMHWQASRQEASRQGREKLPWLTLSKRGEDLRRSGTPWRSSEEAFWIKVGQDHIIPNTGDDYPEGFDVAEALRTFIPPTESVVEFGCGVGRIGKLFEPANYTGFDINPYAILAARGSNPNHSFRMWDFGFNFPASENVLFYTVLLHVSDQRLNDILDVATTSGAAILIAEIMDRRWRREGDPPVFNRDPEDYVQILNEKSYSLTAWRKNAYARYIGETTRDSRITFLQFRKQS